MSEVSDKWGVIVAERGFAQIPNQLLHLNMYVHEDHKLPPAEMVVLLQLVASWWKKDEMPYPSMRTIAERSGISERQVQRAIKALEDKGYIKRSKAKIKGILATNTYDMSLLVGQLKIVAEHFSNKNPRNVTGNKSSSVVLNTANGAKKARSRAALEK
jgi:DNA-binding transcriptional MocR family regulator